ACTRGGRFVSALRSVDARTQFRSQAQVCMDAVEGRPSRGQCRRGHNAVAPEDVREQEVCARIAPLVVEAGETCGDEGAATLYEAPDRVPLRVRQRAKVRQDEHADAAA